VKNLKKIIIIIQARMTSTRLPGKVLKTVLGKSLLEYQLERIRRVSAVIPGLNGDPANSCHPELVSGSKPYIHDIIVATTDKITDDPIVTLCNKLGITVFRGSEDDVLSRYYYAAVQASADTIVRITSDCPLIDPNIIDRVIDFYTAHSHEYSYVSNCLERTYPRGLDTEVFSFQALEQAFLRGNLPVHREHVTPYITQNPELFRQKNIACEQNLGMHRWTVDTQEDFDLIKVIIEKLYPENRNFTMHDVLLLFDIQPKLFFINAHVEQKHV